MEKENLKFLLLNFAEEVTDDKINLIFKKYYSKRNNFDNYRESKKRLTQLILEDLFPNSRQWNIIAKKEGYYSSTSILYIEGITWQKLEKKIIQEIKDILNQ